MNFPPFFQQAPVLRVCDPLAKLLGAPADGVIEYRYSDAVRLAGHSCPTVAGAFLIGRAALIALYPGQIAERGHITVHLPTPKDEGTTGVTAQVLTLLTGAAADNGFKGIGGRYPRRGLLSFAAYSNGDSDVVTFRRCDTGAAVAVKLDLSSVPADPAQRELLTAVIRNQAGPGQLSAFADAWQDRVRRLLQHADDPRVVRVTPIAATLI